MSDDIATRLRKEVAKAENDGHLLSWELAKCAWTAADEIERLRSVSAMLTDEIERLRHERLEWFLVARQLRDAAIAKKEIDEALNDYLRVRGRLEDPRDAAEEVYGE